MNRRRKSAGIVIAGAALLIVSLSSLQAQTIDNEVFDARSLTFRTSLHYDPLLESPLDSLIAMYREADRVDELIGLYESHVEQYPDDAGAKTVLIRLLQKVDRPGADALISSAVPQYPDFAPLQYLFYEFLEKKGDDRSVEILSRAIDLQTNASRRYQWIEELLQVAEGDAGKALAREKLSSLMTLEGLSTEFLLAFARLSQRYFFWEESIVALNRAKATRLSPELQVEVALLLAKAQAELGNRSDAGLILEALLSRLAADHWRRSEILSLRISVVASDEERLALEDQLREAYENAPQDEAAILDYAEFLVAGEKREEAADLLLKTVALLPESATIEQRALTLLETLSSNAVFESFLVSRLEDNPDREDLRFRLVKVRYALGKDADAEQDFEAVVAGLSDTEVSRRILELQRYLRGIDRVEAAGRYLERYVRQNPDQLLIARELCEILVKLDRRENVKEIVDLIELPVAELDRFLDFVSYLVAQDFYQEARRLLENRINEEPDSFDVGLLLINVLAELGLADETSVWIAKLREVASTVPAYADWLNASIQAHSKLESLVEFLQREQNRFLFSEDDWPADKVERFLVLSEAGRGQIANAKIVEAVRQRLQKGVADPALLIRLRQFFVGLLENDPAYSQEVVDQLQKLAEEDPAKVLEYRLRLALVYHRSQRVDLAQTILAGFDFAQITTPDLLRETVGVLLEYQFFRDAETALASINSIHPEDLFSWETRLSVLAATGDEPGFRTTVRKLRSGDLGFTLRDTSRTALDRHLVASYWRSISRLFAPELDPKFDEILPLLASIESEESAIKTQVWVTWCRALVLSRLGRTEEMKIAAQQFSHLTKAQSLEAVRFPDGLTLNTNSAKTLLLPFPVADVERSAPPADFLSEQPHLNWSFEVPEGLIICDMALCGDAVLSFDSAGGISAIEADTGKLRWHKKNVSGVSMSLGKRPDFLPRLMPAKRRPAKFARQYRSFITADDRFILLEGDELAAYAGKNGELLWRSKIPRPSTEDDSFQSSNGAMPRPFLSQNGNRIIYFDPMSGSVSAYTMESGKIVWSRELETSDTPRESGRLFSLNSGLSSWNQFVITFGWSTAILDAGTGADVWSFDGTGSSSFPIILREERNEVAGTTIESGPENLSWQQGRREGPVRRTLLNYPGTKQEHEFPFEVFLERQSQLVGASVYWVKDRLMEEETGMAHLDDSFLWFMKDGVLKRVSLRFPVGSQELPAAGTFLGAQGNHAWFLDDRSLLHLDFYHDRATSISIADIGDAGSFRATLKGNRVYLRGRSGMKIFNALSGNVIGQTIWPAALTSHLKASRALVGATTDPPLVWQGRIHRGGLGTGGYCLPIGDLFADEAYFTVFGDRTLVSLTPEAVTTRPAE